MTPDCNEEKWTHTFNHVHEQRLPLHWRHEMRYVGLACLGHAFRFVRHKRCVSLVPDHSLENLEVLTIH